MFGGFPIDDVPDPIDIRSFVIVVLLSLALDTHGRRDNYLKIVCMLPHINTKDRCEITNDRVLILCPKSISDHQGDPSIYGANLSSDYVELVGLLVFHEPAPSIRQEVRALIQQMLVLNLSFCTRTRCLVALEAHP